MVTPLGFPRTTTDPQTSAKSQGHLSKTLTRVFIEEVAKLAKQRQRLGKPVGGGVTIKICNFAKVTAAGVTAAKVTAGKEMVTPLGFPRKNGSADFCQEPAKVTAALARQLQLLPHLVSRKVP